MGRVVSIFSVMVSLFLSGCFTIQPDIENTCRNVRRAIGIKVILERQNDTISRITPETTYGSYTTTAYVGGQYATATTQGSSVNMSVSCESTDIFYNFTRNRLEDAGFITVTRTPDYIVRYTYFSEGDWSFGNVCKRAAIDICSLLFCISGQDLFCVELRIYDAKTGALCKTIDKQKKYYVTSISPFWIYGHMGNSDMYPQEYQPRGIFMALDAALADGMTFMTEDYARKLSASNQVPAGLLGNP